MAKKQKVTRISGAAASIADTRIFGGEPSFDSTRALSTCEELNAFNWYSYMNTVTEAREYLAAFLSQAGRVSDVKSLGKIPDYAVPMTAAWVVRIESRGGRFATPKAKWIDDKLKDAFKDLVVEVEESDEPTVNVQARIRERAGDLIGDIEAALDARDETFSIYQFFTENKVSGRVVNQIIDYYEPLQEELEDAIEGLDDDLVEAYSCYKPAELKMFREMVDRLLDDAGKFTDNVKKQRKPRKTKVKTPDKILQFFKPKMKDDELKLVSVNPSGILGANEAWLFNVRYKTLTVLRASDPAKGLGVHRTAVTGYDEKTSVTKRVGRKADAILESVLRGGKVARRKLMDTVKTDAIEIKDRVSDDVMLLLVSR